MSGEPAPDAPLVCTIGHSNRPLEAFVELLRGNDVVHVLDVRTVPRSRHNPQFNRDTLPDSLGTSGITYTHLPGLGGLRRPFADSPNSGWRNLLFRGYADYMQLNEFVENVEQGGSNRRRRALRADVCGGRTLALPSFADR